jgi:hypothetical protein
VSLMTTPRALVQKSSSLTLNTSLTSLVSAAKNGRFQLSVRRCKASEAGEAAVVSPSTPLLTRVWTWYTRCLEKRPLTTKMTASALIFFTSDSATQALMDRDAPWDAARASSGAMFGIVAAAYLHVWWAFLEATIGSLVPAARSRILNTAVKVVIDQGCAAPLYIYSLVPLAASRKSLNG